MTAYKITLSDGRELTILSSHCLKDVIEGCIDRFGCSVRQVATWSSLNGEVIRFRGQGI